MFSVRYTLRSGRALPVELLKAYSSIWHPEDYSAESGKKEVQKLLQLLERDHE